MTAFALVVGVLFLFAVIGLACAAHHGRWHRPAPVILSPLFGELHLAHGDVPTFDPRFHLELSAGALRCGDAGAGSSVPSCVAGARTLFSREQRPHA